MVEGNGRLEMKLKSSFKVQERNDNMLRDGNIINLTNGFGGYSSWTADIYYFR
jgi:hypothetical protein